MPEVTPISTDIAQANPVVDRGEIVVNPAGTVLTSLAATVLLSTLATGIKGDLPGAIESVAREGLDLVNPGEDDHNISFGLDVGMQPTGIGNFELPGVGLVVDGTQKDTYNIEARDESRTQDRVITKSSTETIEDPAQSKIEAQEINMEWARLFKEDPNAETISSPSDIQDVVNRVNELESQGYEILGIDLQGTASMEDDTPDTHPNLNNPGFGIESPKNVELANTRAEAVREILEPTLLPELDNPIDISIVNGEEIDDPVLAEQIINYAAENGYDLVTLVKTYNRSPQDLPPEAVKILDGLRDDRLVRVFIKVYKPAESFVEQTNITTIIPGEIIPASDEQKIPNNKDDGGTIYLIPMIIPLIGIVSGRRKDPKIQSKSVPAALPGGSGSDVAPLTSKIPVSVPIGRRVPVSPIRLVGRRPQVFIPPIMSTPLGVGRTQIDSAPISRVGIGGIGVGGVGIDGVSVTPVVETLNSKFDNPFEKVQRSRTKTRVDAPVTIRKQPRNHNMHKNSTYEGGKISRSKGGNRKGKRSLR